MPTPEPKRRWFHLSPDRLVISLLLVVGLLWLSERFQRFGFNHHKGWTVLIAVAMVGVAALVMLLWWIVSLIVHWRFQFGIRSVLVFCLASSIVAGWLAVEMKRARRQAKEVESIRSAGGGLNYDWEFGADGNPIVNPKSPRSAWLRKILGFDFFSTVVVIVDSKITDAGLEHLKELTQCRALVLTGTEITDAGLEHLKDLTQLRELSLGETNITDVGLDYLKGLTQLRVLYLDGTNITDARLKHFTKLTQLQVLGLNDTKITDAGLEQLTELTQVRELELAGTKITDAGLEHLKELTQLQVLNLNFTNITDAGLEHLKGLTQLRVLYLNFTSITDAGVGRLQRVLPNCKIYPPHAHAQIQTPLVSSLARLVHDRTAALAKPAPSQIPRRTLT